MPNSRSLSSIICVETPKMAAISFIEQDLSWICFTQAAGISRQRAKKSL